MNMDTGAGNGAQVNHDMQECISHCEECHRTCLDTATHCLSVGGQHADIGHIRLLADCAEICQTSANFMLRGSDLHGLTCGICAEICGKCASVCEQFPHDTEMARCARTCRTCEESCRRMSEMP